MSRTVVVALGGNALLRRGEPLEAENQARAARDAARRLALASEDNRLVITHGNGPQVGLLALMSESYSEVDPYPLDVLDASSMGQIGYMLELQLDNFIDHQETVTVITRVVVDERDPAFNHPTKFIGPVYDEAAARSNSERYGWTVTADGAHWRRVVPSPEPRRIVQLEAIRKLVEGGFLVVCAGGGGVPVLQDAQGRHRGVEAVIDKDLTASLLAEELGADRLVLMTDVAGVYDHFGTPDERMIERAMPAELRSRERGSRANDATTRCGVSLLGVAGWRVDDGPPRAGTKVLGTAEMGHTLSADVPPRSGVAEHAHALGGTDPHGRHLPFDAQLLEPVLELLDTLLGYHCGHHEALRIERVEVSHRARGAHTTFDERPVGSLRGEPDPDLGVVGDRLEQGAGEPDPVAAVLDDRGRHRVPDLHGDQHREPLRCAVGFHGSNRYWRGVALSRSPGRDDARTRRVRASLRQQQSMGQVPAAVSSRWQNSQCGRTLRALRCTYFSSQSGLHFGSGWIR